MQMFFLVWIIIDFIIFFSYKIQGSECFFFRLRYVCILLWGSVFFCFFCGDEVVSVMSGQQNVGQIDDVDDCEVNYILSGKELDQQSGNW